MSSSSSSNTHRPMWKQLMVAGTSVLPSVILTHPLEVVKVRQQIRSFRGMPPFHNAFYGLATIARHEGPMRLFSGMSPAIGRAYTFGAVRLGLYEPIRNNTAKLVGNSPESPGFGVKVSASLCSGFLATIAGNPFELLKVRMQSGDHAYTGISEAMVKIVRTEGIQTFWTGTQVALIRSSLMCVSQIAIYDHTKTVLRRQQLLQLNNNIGLNFTASMIAGVITTTLCAPADFIKSVLMNAGPQQQGSGSVGSVLKMALKQDSGKSLLSGWLASYARLGPHTVITMMTLDQMRKLMGWKEL